MYYYDYCYVEFDIIQVISMMNFLYYSYCIRICHTFPETFLCHVSFLSLKESKWVISSSVEGSEKKMVCPWAFSLQLCHPVMGEVRGQSSEVRRIPRSCDVGQINNYVSIYFLIFFAILNFFIWKHYTIGAKDKSLIQLILETFASLLWQLLFWLLL